MSLRVLFGLGLAVSLAGCPTSSNPGEDAGEHHSAFPDCDAIVDVCHDVEDADPDALECHNVGHAADSNDDCAAIRDTCVALCEALAMDGGHAHDDDGGHSHDDDAGHSDDDAGHSDDDAGHSHDDDAGHSHDDDAGSSGVDAGT